MVFVPEIEPLTAFGILLAIVGVAAIVGALITGAKRSGDDE